ARSVRTVLSTFRPDVVHVMHAMKLSGAAVQVCVAAGVPVVVTLCDYWFICPRHTLLFPDGLPCSGPESPLKCLPCFHQLHAPAAPPAGTAGDLARRKDALAIAGRADYLRRVLLQARRIIALSRFLKLAFVRNGYPAERIEVIEHGLELELP